VSNDGPAGAGGAADGLLWGFAVALVEDAPAIATGPVVAVDPDAAGGRP
jgi:hypothetical protein